MELTLYSFDAYVLDPTEQTLSRAGCRVPLTPKAFATLLMLVQRSGQVVHKDDLMKSIWGDVCVEEANLTQNIFTLRRIFAEGIDGKKYIETVPRLGYRFIASVSQIQRGPRTIPLLHSEKEQPKKSIAVVSFGHSDDDTQFEYLADGMVESIINSLSELPQLRVMAWSAVARYKGKNKDAREIGAELGVTNVLSARLRHINTKLMISAELLDVIDGWHLWGDAFSCDAHGLAEVQEQIAKKTSDALKLKLTVDERERLARRYTENSEAYLHYLRGRYQWAKYTKQSLGTAIKCYRRAIELDPTYALAYVGIADAYFRLSTTFLPPLKTLPKAKAAAQKALEIDDQLAEAHTSMGKASLHLRQWDVAEAELRKAIQLKEGYALAHLSSGTLHGLRCDFDEALKRKKMALQLDPLSLQINVSFASTLWTMRDYEGAKRQLLETLEMDENFQSAYFALALVHEQQRNYSAAIEQYEKAMRIGETSFLVGFLARVYALSGDEARANALIYESIAQAKTRYISPYSIALAFVGLGELDSAFVWFEKAYETYDEWLLFAKQDRRLDRLRHDPRLLDLLTRIGLS